MMVVLKIDRVISKLNSISLLVDNIDDNFDEILALVVNDWLLPMKKKTDNPKLLFSLD
jgi:hypothetical protein